MPSAIPKQKEEGRMLADLENAAAQGQPVDIKLERVRDILDTSIGGVSRRIVALSIIYSGRVSDTPFSFKKNYSFGADEEQHENALKCLLIANTRLQVDLDRLKQAGIGVERQFFTLQNCFAGVNPATAPVKPFLRIENFIHLAHAEVPVSVDVKLSCPATVSHREGVARNAHCCVATFLFTVGGDGKPTECTRIDKLYCYNCEQDAEACRQKTNSVANSRLAHDCNRLRAAGIDVDIPTF